MRSRCLSGMAQSFGSNPGWIPTTSQPFSVALSGSWRYQKHLSSQWIFGRFFDINDSVYLHFRTKRYATIFSGWTLLLIHHVSSGPSWWCFSKIFYSRGLTWSFELHDNRLKIHREQRETSESRLLVDSTLSKSTLIQAIKETRPINVERLQSTFPFLRSSWCGFFGELEKKKESNDLEVGS